MNIKWKHSSCTVTAHATPTCAHAVLMQASSCALFSAAHSWFVSCFLIDTWHQWACQFSYVLSSCNTWCIWMHHRIDTLMNSCIWNKHLFQSCWSYGLHLCTHQEDLLPWCNFSHAGTLWLLFEAHSASHPWPICPEQLWDACSWLPMPALLSACFFMPTTYGVHCKSYDVLTVKISCFYAFSTKIQPSDPSVWVSQTHSSNPWSSCSAHPSMPEWSSASGYARTMPSSQAIQWQQVHSPNALIPGMREVLDISFSR